VDRRLFRIQVKTCTLRLQTPNGHERWEVSIVTNGGNQSWTGVATTFDPSRFDLLFVLTGAGRRWLIPAEAIESTHGLNLGGPKYSEFEIEHGSPIDSLVYRDAEPLLESESPQGEYPSGQRKRSVKAPANAFAGSNPASPIDQARPHDRLADGSPIVGQTCIYSNLQMRFPRAPLRAGGFAVGDRLRVQATGPGEATIKRIEPAAQLPLPESADAQ
jgi:hypothetical protein